MKISYLSTTEYIYWSETDVVGAECRYTLYTYTVIKNVKYEKKSITMSLLTMQIIFSNKLKIRIPIFLFRYLINF